MKIHQKKRNKIPYLLFVSVHLLKSNFQETTEKSDLTHCACLRKMSLKHNHISILNSKDNK